MRKADPRVKLLWVILSTGGALLFVRPAWMVGVCLFTVSGMLFFGAQFEMLQQRLKGLLPLLLFLGLLQLAFTRSGTPLLTLGGKTFITEDGLRQALNTALRLLVIMGAAAVMAAENSRRVIAALNAMGLPYLFCFLLLTALRFIPFFGRVFAQALTALQLRGLQPDKLSFKQRVQLYRELLLPVVTDAVYRAETLAVAMQARGFGARPQRSSYLTVSMTATDWLLTAVLLGLGGGALRFYYLS